MMIYRNKRTGKRYRWLAAGIDCTTLGYPVPWTQMIESDCKGINSPRWQPIEVARD